MRIILCVLNLHILFLLGKPAKLYETTHLDWAHPHFTRNMGTIAEVPLQQQQKDMKT